MSASRFWVPADEALSAATQAMSAFQGLATHSRTAFAESRDLPAAQRRQITPGFVQAFPLMFGQKFGHQDTTRSLKEDKLGFPQPS